MNKRKYPERPRGFYMRYLERLIEENRVKRKPAADICDDEYWRKRREDEAMKDLPLKKAA
jgi:hypothetical protein